MDGRVNGWIGREEEKGMSAGPCIRRWMMDGWINGWMDG